MTEVSSQPIRSWWLRLALLRLVTAGNQQVMPSAVSKKHLLELARQITAPHQAGRCGLAGAVRCGREPCHRCLPRSPGLAMSVRTRLPRGGAGQSARRGAGLSGSADQIAAPRCLEEQARRTADLQLRITAFAGR